MPSVSPNDPRRIHGRRFRTELCKTYMATGHCKYHNRCMFAHGIELLRTEQQNETDGLNCESAIRAWAKAHRPEGPMPGTPTSPMTGVHQPLCGDGDFGAAFAQDGSLSSESSGAFSLSREPPTATLQAPRSRDCSSSGSHSRMQSCWWRYDPYSLLVSVRSTTYRSERVSV